jgi:hypothetical protein
MSRVVKIALLAGLLVLAAMVAVAITRSPSRVARVGVPTGNARDIELVRFTNDISVCQADEALPAGVSAVRLAMWAFYGAKVHVRIYGSDSQILTEGSRGGNWTSDSVTVPIRPVAHSASGVTLCFGVGPNSQPIIVMGNHSPLQEAATGALGHNAPTPAASHHALLQGRVGVEYLSTAQGTWWSHALAVARRMGLGRAYSGSWIALLVAALMAAVGALALTLTLRELP